MLPTLTPDHKSQPQTSDEDSSAVWKNPSSSPRSSLSPVLSHQVTSAQCPLTSPLSASITTSKKPSVMPLLGHSAHNLCLASQSSEFSYSLLSAILFWLFVSTRRFQASVSPPQQCRQWGQRPSLGGRPRSCGVRSSAPGPAHSSPCCDNCGAT